MSQSLPSIAVVLCRPQDPGNVGSCCRAMKTMGITHLRIVGPFPGEAGPARTLAVHALDVLQSAAHFETLEEAVRGSSLVAGVTRREGKWRKQLTLFPEELAERVAAQAGAPVSLVFGNEESGLSDLEMESCHLGVAIPSSPLFPSLNLSHAVQVVSYALFRRLGGPVAKRYLPAPGERVEAVADALMASLREAGYFTQGHEREMRLLFRDLFARAALSESEAERVQRCFGIQQALIAELRRPD